MALNYCCSFFHPYTTKNHQFAKDKDPRGHSLLRNTSSSTKARQTCSCFLLPTPSVPLLLGRLSKYGEGQMYWTEVRCKGSLKTLGIQIKPKREVPTWSVAECLANVKWPLKAFRTSFLPCRGEPNGIFPKLSLNGMKHMTQTTVIF